MEPTEEAKGRERDKASNVVDLRPTRVWKKADRYERIAATIDWEEVSQLREPYGYILSIVNEIHQMLCDRAVEKGVDLRPEPFTLLYVPPDGA